MSHYFDEVLSRHKQQIDSPRASRPLNMLRRRSSAGRSMGARSDFDLEDLEVLDRDDRDTDRDTDIDTRSVTAASVILQHDIGPEEIKRRAEANEHMHRYISDQLERFKDENAGQVDVEEFEAKP